MGEKEEASVREKLARMEKGIVEEVEVRVRV